jgi:sortase (surface protein transpeptidase)
MDRKLKLDFNALSVCSFATQAKEEQQRGTVEAHGVTLTTCDPYGACNTRNTCTTNLC